MRIKFEWIVRGGCQDDFICKHGDYILRVEQMDRGQWWWRTYYKGDSIVPYDNEHSTSKFRAFGLAEGACLSHLYTNYHKMDSK